MTDIDPEITAYDTCIRMAYRDLVRDTGHERGDYVSLTDLRRYLGGGGDRELVDAALRRMGRGDYPGPGEVSLVPQANQKTLSQLDRQAAVELAGEPLHLIAIR